MLNIPEANNIDNNEPGEVESTGSGAVMGVINPHSKAINAADHMQKRFAAIKRQHPHAQRTAVAGHMNEFNRFGQRDSSVKKHIPSYR
jgi:hypothetical protein